MHYQINPMTDHGIGAEVLGVDLTQPVSGAPRRHLYADFGRFHVLAIRDQKFSVEQFIQAGTIFGEIMPHHRKSGNISEHLEVYEIRSMSEVRQLHRIMIKGTPIPGESVSEAERGAAPAQRAPVSQSS